MHIHSGCIKILIYNLMSETLQLQYYSGVLLYTYSPAMHSEVFLQKIMNININNMKHVKLF